MKVSYMYLINTMMPSVANAMLSLNGSLGKQGFYQYCLCGMSDIWHADMWRLRHVDTAIWPHDMELHVSWTK